MLGAGLSIEAAVSYSQHFADEVMLVKAFLSVTPVSGTYCFNGEMMTGDGLHLESRVSCFEYLIGELKAAKDLLFDATVTCTGKVKPRKSCPGKTCLSITPVSGTDHFTGVMVPGEGLFLEATVSRS